MRSEFSEVEGNEELSGSNDWPRPEKRGATGSQTEIEESESASRNRDVGESDCEIGEEPQRPLQFLLVAKLLQ